LPISLFRRKCFCRLKLIHLFVGCVDLGLVTVGFKGRDIRFVAPDGTGMSGMCEPLEPVLFAEAPVLFFDCGGQLRVGECEGKAGAPGVGAEVVRGQGA